MNNAKIGFAVYFVFTRNPFRRNKMTKEKAKKLKLKFPRRHAPTE